MVTPITLLILIGSIIIGKILGLLGNKTSSSLLRNILFFVLIGASFLIPLYFTQNFCFGDIKMMLINLLSSLLLFSFRRSNATNTTSEGEAQGMGRNDNGKSNNTDTTTQEPDDLTIIEGIGPKIEELFNAKGIFTFKQLTQKEVGYLKSILENAGPAFKYHDPQTWPKQAELAVNQERDKLHILQDALDGGRIV